LDSEVVAQDACLQQGYFGHLGLDDCKTQTWLG
jgi:hypothetical protein